MGMAVGLFAFWAGESFPERIANNYSFLKKTFVFWGWLSDNQKIVQRRPTSEAVDLPAGVSVRDYEILTQVAWVHELNDEERLLLYVIRFCENGGPGLEMGVMNPGARLYNDGEKSMWLQSHWAARMVKKNYQPRFHGDLKKFQGWWAPVGAKNDPTNLNTCWFPSAKKQMEKWRGRLRDFDE